MSHLSLGQSQDPSHPSAPDPPRREDKVPDPATLPQRLSYLAQVGRLAALYFAAGKLGLSLAAMHANVSLVWPPTGIALGALLLFGYRLWPGIALGAFLLNASTDVSLATAAGIAVGNTLEAVSGAYLLHRFGRFGNSLERLQDVLGFVALAAVLSTMVSATVGVTSLGLGGAAPWAAYGSLWWQWWLGDLMGVLVVAPVLLTWGTPPRTGWQARQVAEAGTLLVSLAAVTTVVFRWQFPTGTPHYPLAYTIFPFVIWAALRFGPRGAASATLAMSAIAVWGTAGRLGPFLGATLTESLLLLQSFFSVVAVSGLLLAAAINQRRRAEEGLRNVNEQLEIRVVERTTAWRRANELLERELAERKRAEEGLREGGRQLAEAQRIAQVGSWEWDIQANTVVWSAELYRIYGLKPHEFEATYEAYLKRVHPEDLELAGGTIERALRDRKPFTFVERIIRPDATIRLLRSQGEVIADADGKPLKLVGICQDITERKRAEETLQQLHQEAEDRRQEAEAFTTLVRDLGSLLNLDQILGRLVARAKALSQGDVAWIALVDPDGQTLTIRAQTGAASPPLQRLTVEKGKGMAGRVLETGAPLVTTDSPQDQWPPHAAEGDGAASAEQAVTRVAVPILDEGTPLGILLVGRRTYRPFTASDVEVLKRLADAAGLACHHALLYEQATSRAAALERLWQLGQALSRSLALRETLDQVVRAARELVRADHAILTLWDEGSQTLTAAARGGEDDDRLPRRFRPGEGIHGTVAATQRPLVVNDYQAFPARISELTTVIVASIAVPLLSEGRLIGTLGVYTTDAGKTFTDDDLRLLEFLAPAAAIALENARLHDATVRRGEELAALLRSTRTVMAGLDLTTTLQRIVEEAARIVGTLRATVFLVDKDARVLRPGAVAMGSALPDFEIPLGSSFSGTVAATGQPLFVGDTRSITQRLLTEQERASGFVTYLGIPITIREEVAGVLAFYSEALRQYSQEELTTLASFADQAAIALQNARLFEQVRAGRERLQVVSRRLVETQEAKSRQLARELHDEIGQILTGLKLSLEVIIRSGSKESKGRLREAQALVDDLLARVRDLSLDLRPAMLDDLGLLPALLWQFERYTAQTHVRVEFKHTGLEGNRFPPEVETAVYRIVQEALTNVARHAGVSEATVRLWASGEMLGVQIEDRGKGFDPAAPLTRSTSIGLAGMRERATLLGGHLSVESTPGAGTRVTAELPVGGPIERRTEERGA